MNKHILTVDVNVNNILYGEMVNFEINCGAIFTYVQLCKKESECFIDKWLVCPLDYNGVLLIFVFCGKYYANSLWH